MGYAESANSYDYSIGTSYPESGLTVTAVLSDKLHLMWVNSYIWIMVATYPEVNFIFTTELTTKLRWSKLVITPVLSVRATLNVSQELHLNSCDWLLWRSVKSYGCMTEISYSKGQLVVTPIIISISYTKCKSIITSALSWLITLKINPFILLTTKIIYSRDRPKDHLHHSNIIL